MALGTFLQRISKGEGKGHPYRGNQHDGGRPGLGSKLPAHRDPATPDGREKADLNAAKVAESIREHVVKITPGLSDAEISNSRARSKGERFMQFDEGDEALSARFRQLDQDFKDAAHAKSEALLRLTKLSDHIADLDDFGSIGDAFGTNVVGAPDKWGDNLGYVFLAAYAGYTKELSRTVGVSNKDIVEEAAKTTTKFTPGDGTMGLGDIGERLGTQRLWDPNDPSPFVTWGRTIAARPDADRNFQQAWEKLETAANTYWSSASKMARLKKEIVDFTNEHAEYVAAASTNGLPMMGEGFRHPTAGLEPVHVDPARWAAKADIVEKVGEQLYKTELAQGYQYADKVVAKERTQQLLDQWADTSNDANENAARFQIAAAKEFGREASLKVNIEWRQQEFEGAVRQIINNHLTDRSKAMGDYDYSTGPINDAHQAVAITHLLSNGIAEHGHNYFSHDSTSVDPDSLAVQVKSNGKYQTTDWVSKAEQDVWTALGHKLEDLHNSDYEGKLGSQIGRDQMTAKMILQAATATAAEHRQGGPLMAMGDARRPQTDADGWGANNSDDAKRRLLRETYEHTQQTLRNMGIKPNDLVMIYRGAETPEKIDTAIRWGDNVSWRNKENRDSIIHADATQEITTNPLSSWALTPIIAKRFGPDASIYSAAVRAKDIFSLSTTGPGCLTESEVVLLGGTYKARTFEVTT